MQNAGDAGVLRLVFDGTFYNPSRVRVVKHNLIHQHQWLDGVAW